MPPAADWVEFQRTPKNRRGVGVSSTMGKGSPEIDMMRRRLRLDANRLAKHLDRLVDPAERRTPARDW